MHIFSSITDDNMYKHKHIKKDFIDGKGHGYIALQNIKKFTILLIDESIVPKFCDDTIDFEMLIMYFLIESNDSRMQQFEELLPQTIEFDRVSINNLKTRILKIKNNKMKTVLSKNINKVLLFLEKYKRNAFNLDNTESIIIPGILLNGAIFNHSCDPNVSFTYSNSKMYFFANRDIKKGEELCDSYVNISMNSEKRTMLLKQRYGFDCNCTSCITKSIANRSNEIMRYRTINIKELFEM